MKILLVNKFFYKRGGSETYYFALGDILKGLGHEVIWFSMKGPDNLPCEQAEYFTENVDYHASSSPAKKLKDAVNMISSNENRRRFERLLADERPDIVHVNNIHRQITLSILDSCKAHNIPVVATSHDWIYVCPSYLKTRNGEVCELCQNGDVWNCFRTGCMQGSKMKSLLATIEALYHKRHGSYNQIDVYIAPSDCMAKRMSAAGFTSSAIIQMYNFLPSLELPQEKPTEPAYFVFLGRLSPEKGLTTLIRAFAKAKTGAALHLVGDGPQRQELEALSEELGIKEKIVFTGTRYGEELLDIVSHSLALVLPSEVMENCPYSVMEALSMGKPVIGSRIGGIPELIQQGITGVCFETKNVDELADALLSMKSMPQEQYEKMTLAAREYAVTFFSAESYGNRLVNIYRELLAKKGGQNWNRTD